MNDWTGNKKTTFATPEQIEAWKLINDGFLD